MGLKKRKAPSRGRVLAHNVRSMSASQPGLSLSDLSPKTAEVLRTFAAFLCGKAAETFRSFAAFVEEGHG